jgi:hypothetical protein
MAGLMDASQLLDIDVEQISGGGMFVPHAGRTGFSMATLFSLSRTRMRLTVARLRPVD